MKRYVSFSLFGDIKLYCEGMLENIPLIEKYYPGWSPIVYIAENCPALRSLEEMKVETVVMPPIQGVDRINDKDWTKDFRNAAMSWRYNVLDREDCERAIFRDADSRVNPRESDAVSEWIESGMLAHSIYDCEAHTKCMVMPGISAIVGGIHSNITEMYNNYYLHEYPKLNEPLIFFDIWFFYQKFIEPISFSWMRHGYDQPFPLKTPMDLNLGKHVGATVQEEWRSLKFN